MTKEELSAKIAQGEYTDCKKDGKFSLSVKINGTGVSISKVGNTIVAMSVISIDINEEEYNKILKQALYNELASVEVKQRELLEEIKKL